MTKRPLPPGWKDMDIADYPQYQPTEQVKVTELDITDNTTFEDLVTKLGIPIIPGEDLIDWIEEKGKYAKN